MKTPKSPKTSTRRFKIAFGIAGRYGRFSYYSLKDICVSIVDRWSLTDREVNHIANMEIGESFDIATELKMVRVR